jgi:ABC-type multidrug transport system fused ATPase/permease subunit
MKMNTSTCERGSADLRRPYSVRRHEHHIAFCSRDLVCLNRMDSNENAGPTVEIGEANFDREVCNATQPVLVEACNQLSFCTRSRTSNLVVRLISDLGLLQGMVMPMRAKAPILVGMFALIFWLNWRLALVALLAPWSWPCQALDVADGLSVPGSARIIINLLQSDMHWFRAAFGTNLAVYPVAGHVRDLHIPAVQEALVRLFLR